MRGVSTSTMRLTVLAGVAAIALAAPAAAPAAAGSIGVSAGTLLFQAGPLTTNRVTITRIPLTTGNVFYGADDTGPAATIELGTGCSLQAGAIRCGYTPAGTFVDVLRIRAILGDGDDTFLLSQVGTPPFTLPASITGGPGADRITSADGPDVIVAGQGANTVRGNGGNDRLEMRNARRDVLIDCGVGIDTAVIDRVDPKPIACETVLRAR